MDPDTTTPKAATPSEGEAPHFFCERCWRNLSVKEASHARCVKCHAEAPPGGFRALPIRFKSRFLFLAPLGRGGQAAVFRAQDLEELDASGVPEERAVKVMPLDAPDEQHSDLRDRFGREASASKKFTHELRDKAKRRFFVASVADDLGSVPYIALELVLWPTLTKLLCDTTTKPPTVTRCLTAVETVHLGVSLLAGVAVMHDKRVVHRDLKPDNLFVSDADGRFDVKIADFGIWTEPTTAAPGEGSVRRGIVGTLKYMSPEQQCAQAVDARSDLHAVGSILWFAATGAVPYPWEQTGTTPADEQRAFTMRLTALQKVPPRPASMPEGLYEVLARALAYAPDDRHPDAATFAAALGDLERRWVAEHHDAVESMRRALVALQAKVAARAATVQPAVGAFNSLSLLARDAAEVEHSIAAATTADIERLRVRIQQLNDEGLRLDREVDALSPPPSPAPPPTPPPPARTDVVPRRAFFASLGAVGLLTALVVVLVLRPPERIVTPPLPPVTVTRSVTIPQGGYARDDLRGLLRGLNKFIPIGGQFSLQRHEVTRGEFALWLDSPEGRAHPIPWRPRDEARTDRSAVATLDASSSVLPVVHVDHREAAAWCAALGAALPTEEHWLQAFREGSWGELSRFVASSTLHSAREIGADATPRSRIYWLLGNAREWLRAPDAATSASYIGGSYNLGGADLLQNATSPTAAAVTYRSDQLGFRCEAEP